MKHSYQLLLTMFIAFSLLCSLGAAKDKPSPFWIAREDNGDKPSIEYHLWVGADGKLSGEMWLVTVENGKDQERGSYPITITARDQLSLTFIYKSGNGDQEQVQITFSKALSAAQESAVLEDGHNKQKHTLVFARQTSGSN